MAARSGRESGDSPSRAHDRHLYPSNRRKLLHALDDLTRATLGRLASEGFAPAAVVETSPGNFQAWLRHAQPLPKELGTLAAKTLAERFGADRSAADWRRFGRAPGFTNHKPQHREPHGLYPFARLIRHTGQLTPNAAALRSDLEALQEKARQERTALRLSLAARSTRFPILVSLSRFRSSPRYEGRPAAADMAFCIAACSHGWSESDISAALSRDYLSRDPSHTRQNSYIRRTIAKAMRWAA